MLFRIKELIEYPGMSLLVGFNSVEIGILYFLNEEIIEVKVVFIKIF